VIIDIHHATDREKTDFFEVFQTPPALTSPQAARIIVNLAVREMAKNGIRRFTVRNIADLIETKIIHHPSIRRLSVPKWGRKLDDLISIHNTTMYPNQKYICVQMKRDMADIRGALTWWGHRNLGKQPENKSYVLWSIDDETDEEFLKRRGI